MTKADINVLRVQADLGKTFAQALAMLPGSIDKKQARQAVQKAGIRFRKAFPRARRSNWVAAACREYFPDYVDRPAAERVRIRACIRFRVNNMGLTIDEAMTRDIMSPRESGRLGAAKKWGQ